MRDIKEYIHHYLGCDVYVFPYETISNGWLKEKLIELPQLEYKYKMGIGDLVHTIRCGYKPILRKLSSMTEEELKKWVGSPALSFTDHYCKKSLSKINHSIYGLYNFISFYGNSDSIPWLLSKHFDLFDLISSGLAIDKDELEKVKL